jgi:hypothetical protein
MALGTSTPYCAIRERLTVDLPSAVNVSRVG